MRYQGRVRTPWTWCCSRQYCALQERRPPLRSSWSFCFLRDVGLSTSLRLSRLAVVADSLAGLLLMIFSRLTIFFLSTRRSMVFSSLLKRLELLSIFSSCVALSKSFGYGSSCCNDGSSYSPARLVDARDLAPLMVALLRCDVEPVLEKDVAIVSDHGAFL